MSHKDQPEYFTLASVCPYNGNVTIHGIFENMDAVVYRMLNARNIQNRKLNVLNIKQRRRLKINYIKNIQKKMKESSLF